MVVAAEAETKKPTIEAKDIEVFESGLQIDSDGRAKIWTVPELDEIVEAYNSIVDTHEAPVIPAPNQAAIQVGHEDEQLSDHDSDPEFQKHGAYGWVGRVRRQGGKLLADYSQVDPRFAEMVNQGRYKHRSISIYPRDHATNPTPGRLNIRHVAYVRIPAVKGLQQHEIPIPQNFSDSGEKFFEFCFPSEQTMDYAAIGITAYNAIGAIAALMVRQRERVIETEGMERANEDFPEEAIRLIQEEAQKPPGEFATVDALELLGTQLFSQIDLLNQKLYQLSPTPPSQDPAFPSYTESSTMPNEPPAPQFTAQQFAELQQQISQLSQELTLSKNRVSELESINAQKAHDDEVASISQFVETAVQNRQIFPHEKANKIAFILNLSNDPTKGINFSEGGATTQLSPREVYQREILSRPPLWSNEDMPTGEANAPASFSEYDLAGQAQALQSKYKQQGVHKSLSECIDLIESGKGGQN